MKTSIKRILLFIVDVVFTFLAVICYSANKIRYGFDSALTSARRYYEQRKINVLIKRGEMLP